MRITFLCLCAMMLGSSSCQEVVHSDPIEEIQAEDGTRATVTTAYADEGCKVLLEIEEEGQKVLLLPIELDDQYKVNGLELLIEFHSSRIMQSECQKGRPIVIEKVKLIE